MFLRDVAKSGGLVVVDRPPEVTEPVQVVSREVTRSPLRDFIRQFTRNRLAVIGLALVLVMVMIAFLAPVLSPMNPYTAYPDGTTAAGAPLTPTWQWHHFFLGTDNLGRDVMSRLIWGTRVSMEVGVMATLISIVIGLILGIFSGYSGGWVDNALMRVTDVVLAFPLFLFVILLNSVVPHPSVITVYTVIGILGWAGAARIARGQALSTRSLEFVDAARSLGASRWRILFHHILPSVLPPVLVYGTLLIPNNIILESALSFLGIGVPDPTVSWGKMINLGLDFYQIDPWLIIFPGVMIGLATLGFNLMGDGLNDALAPYRNR